MPSKNSRDPAMSPDGFKAWRKGLGLKQKDAADLLGLKKRVIQYYEKGSRDGKSVEIPKTVRLACYALAHGVEDFDGERATYDGPEQGRTPANGAAQPDSAN